MKYDVIIIGAGAAGLLCGYYAGLRGRRVCILDHANKPGKKILMSGGGYCNFTNYYIEPERYLSQNPHFCKSALSRYTQWDFIQLVERFNIAYHEKSKGELFCDHKSKDILNMLLALCQEAQVKVQCMTTIKKIEKGDGFRLQTSRGAMQCDALVVATGGLSIPTMGASPYGYQIAEQFELDVLPVRAGLVPFTLHDADKERFSPLSGVSAYCCVSNERMSFTDDCLFTHRGLSGPAMLQMSSYWLPGEALTVNFFPERDLSTELNDGSAQQVRSFLQETLAKRLVATLCPDDLLTQPIKSLNPVDIKRLQQIFQYYQLKPNATEGYRTAEVTLGGLSCAELSSKTFESRIPKLYFIGEVIDVTGWLGGYNFQWAWSSAWAAAQAV